MPTIDVAGGRLSWREAGAGTPVLLIGGTAENASRGTGVAQELGERYRVLVPDLAAHGGTSAVTPKGHFSIDDEAELMTELVARCDEPVHLVGHSYGGAVALKMALRWPDWIRTLTVVEPAAFHLLRSGDRVDRRVLSQIEAVSGLVAAGAASGHPECGMAGFVDFWNGNGTWSALDPDVRTALAAQIGDVLRHFESLYRETWSLAALGRMSVPTMVVMGLESPAVARRVATLVASATTGAWLSRIPGAGHMAPFTHPEVVAGLILRNLARTDARTLIFKPVTIDEAA